MGTWLQANWVSLIGSSIGVVGLIYGMINGTRRRRVENVSNAAFAAFWNALRKAASRWDAMPVDMRTEVSKVKRDFDELRDQSLHLFFVGRQPSEYDLRKLEESKAFDEADVNYLRKMMRIQRVGGRSSGR